MKEVSHHIRKAYLDALAPLNIDGVPVPVVDEELPIGYPPAKIGAAEAYVIITDQNEVESDFNFCGIIQDCSITIDVVTKYAKGAGGKLLSERISDEIQNIVNPFREVNMTIDADFRIMSIRKELSRGLIEQTETKTAYRKIIIYANKINQKQSWQT